MTNDKVKTNLIGISGKIGSGKDTVGAIIQYLTDDKNGKLPYRDWYASNAYSGYVQRDNTWQVQKFAGKLKDTVCLLIGCTREQLEDINFKDRKLPECWTKYGIIRRDGNRHVEIHATRKEAEARLPIWEKGAWIDTIEMTPRLLLQLLGTEAGRDIIHPNIWVNALFADFHSESGRMILMDLDSEKAEVTELARRDRSQWIVTDMRFPNEKKAIEDHAGITIRIERDIELRYPELWKAYQESNEETWVDFLSNKGLLKSVYHYSETALDKEEQWNYIIDNNGDLNQLIDQVREVLQIENLL